MSLSRIFFLVSFLLFSAIGVLTVMKRHAGTFPHSGTVPKEEPVSSVEVQTAPSSLSQEKVDLSLLQGEKKKKLEDSPRFLGKQEITSSEASEPVTATDSVDTSMHAKSLVIEHEENEQEAIEQLFMKNSSCPIVETVRYSSRVSWKPKKAAWLVDYANHYKTPLDFLIRSLTGTVGGETPAVKEGQQFTVLRQDIPFYFQLVISFASRKMRLYYVLPKEKRVVFLKGYSVCLGRKDPQKVSGSLTPLGVYRLGSRIACFGPKMMGRHKGSRIELIRVFGTRWIPFEKEVTNCSEPAKGFGIHGAPLLYNTTTGLLEEDLSSIGEFVSDGCIRLKRQDVEELFSVISSRATYVEIVPEFRNSTLFQGVLYQ